jgi:glycosyltransferase involved in cell wall biosynthesis
VAAERIVVIPNWVPGEAVSPLPADASALRRREGLSNKTVLLYSGNIGLAHEFDTLIAAARRLAGRDDVALLFVGGGKRLPELRAAAEQFGDLFRFLPAQPLEGLSDALAAGDVHLITMRESVNGLIAPSKVYGALAAGRPIVFIGPQQSEVARLIREADVGCVVRPGEAERLTRCLETLIDDPQRRAELGRRARAVYELRFGWERSCRRFAEVLDRVVKDV